MASTTYQVSGMSCGHCVKSVTEELSELAGVTKVTIELVPNGTSTVVVDSAAELPAEDVRAAVAEAGYELVGAA